MRTAYRFELFLLPQLAFGLYYAFKTLNIIFLCFEFHIDFTKRNLPLFNFDNFFKRY